MRVLLLGHRGLIGRAFAAHLTATGAEVVGIDSTNAEGLSGASGDLILNADGSSDRPLAEADPLASFRLNVDVTLWSLTRLHADRYIHISTIGVYSAGSDLARTREDAALDVLAMTNYGRFKWLGEILVRAHARQWLIARVGPVVGPGLRKNSVYDLLEKRTLLVHPDSTMPYIDTRDVARIVWSLRDDANEIFNVTGDGLVRLADLAKELGVDLPADRRSLAYDSWDIDISKLRSRVAVPRSWDTVRTFVRERTGSQPQVDRPVPR